MGFSKPPKRQLIQPLARDVIVTAGASFASFAAGLVLISVVGRLWGITLLTEYLLLRRVAAWLQPLAHSGIGVALPRHVAYSSEESVDSQIAYFVAASVCILTTATLFGMTFGIANQPLARILFGSSERSPLLLALLLLLVGASAQMAVYGFYRGRLQMKRAAAMQIAVAVIPIIAVCCLFWTHSVVIVVSAIGLGVFATAAAFAIPIFSELCRTTRVTALNLAGRIREMLAYGIPRIPGDLSFGALLAITPVVASHYMPMAHISALLIAISMLSAAGLSTEPLGLVLLSKVSRMLAQHRTTEVRNYLSCLMTAVVNVASFMAIQLIVFADVIVRAWIGPSLNNNLAAVRIVLVGIPFYLFYTALRSSVDAGSTRPLNALNAMLSLAALSLMIGLALLISLTHLLETLAAALVLSFALLAFRTGMVMLDLFHAKVEWRTSLLPISVSVLLGVIAVICKQLLSSSIAPVFILELLFTSAFVGACLYSNAPWVQLLRCAVLQRSRTVQTRVAPVLTH